MGANFLAAAASGSVSNSNFDASNGTWTSAGNTTLGHVTTPVHTGAGACQLKSQAAGNITAAHCTAAAIATRGMPVKPGQLVTVTGWFITALHPRTCQVGYVPYTAAGAQVGSPLTGTGVIDATAGWSQAAAKLTVPATAAYVRAYVIVTGAAAANEVHYLDDMVMTLASGAIPAAYLRRLLCRR